MNEQEKERLDVIKSKKDVQRALQAAKRKKSFRVVATTKDKVSLATYILVLLGLAVFRYILKIDSLLNLDFLNHFLPAQLQLSEKLVSGAMTVVLVLTLTKLIKVFFINGIGDTATKYNLQRVLNLLVGIVLFFIIISILFANWYTAVVSLGLISLILGFALQIPLTSFIAWVHIIISRPYKVGDRIKLGESTGDVIDLGYLETTLWESSGESLSNTFPTGRIIKFPNSLVLSHPVYNYSWPLFPYIWDDVKFYVGLTSDIEIVSSIMRSTTEREMGPELSERIHLYHEILKETPVDEKQIVEKPEVTFRIHENVWIEVRVRYLVEPKQAATLKNSLVQKILSDFKKNSDKIFLPLGTER